MKNGQVEDEETMSDHRYITFTVEDEEASREEKEELRWATKRADREKFAREMANCVIEEGEGIEEATDKLYKAIHEASKKAIPRTRGRARRVYWWTEEIRKIRMETNQARRRASRRRSAGQNDQDLEERYKAKREELKKEIQRSKQRAWKRLCLEVEQDPWGLPYRVVAGKLKKVTPGPGAYVQGGVDAVIERLFPREEGDRDMGDPRGYTTPEVKMKEVLEATGRLPGRKAPGPDGYPNEIIRMVVEANPEAVRKVVDLSLKEGMPQRWKTAKLVLLWKQGKPRDRANSYRPVCLLDGLAKIVERVITDRITEAIKEREETSIRQFGFVKGRSTIDAVREVRRIAEGANSGPLRKRQHCIMATLDVQNAFNSLPHRTVMEEARRRLPGYLVEVVEDYLSGRRLRYEESGNVRLREMDQGVPQGSVLGPTLWNLVYDGALRTSVPEGATTIAFADDLAIVARARGIEEAKGIMKEAIGEIEDWMKGCGLRIAREKTALVLLSTRRAGREKEEEIVLGGDTRIKITKSIKYLGVTLEANRRCSRHIEEVSAAAARTDRAVARILPNEGGAGEGRRRLLATVARAKLLYAAPIWAEGTRVERNRRKMRGATRPGLLRITRAYRTVSTDALEVLAGMMPIDIEARARRRADEERRGGRTRAEAKEMAKEEGRREWQTQWDGNTGWTKRTIPQIRAWVDREFGQLSYHLTQLLTGHGAFNSYLNKIGKKPSANCSNCTGQKDTAEHVLIRCPRWEDERARMARKIGEIGENVGEIMLISEECWEAVGVFAKEVLQIKDKE